MNDKIDLILEKVSSLEAGQQELKSDYQELKAGQQELKSDYQELKAGQQELKAGYQELKAGQQKLEISVQNLEAGQQRNYDLIQKIGIKVEQVDSNVKGVAEGHGVLLNKIDEVISYATSIDRKLDDTNLVVKETNRRLREHLQQPAHAL